MVISEDLRNFLLEGHENLDAIEAELVELERDPSDRTRVQSVFRALHTIKGNSGFLGFTRCEALSHQGEALLEGIRSGSQLLTSELATELLEVIDSLREILHSLEKNGVEPEGS